MIKINYLGSAKDPPQDLKEKFESVVNEIVSWNVKLFQMKGKKMKQKVHLSNQSHLQYDLLERQLEAGEITEDQHDKLMLQIAKKEREKRKRCGIIVDQEEMIRQLMQNDMTDAENDETETDSNNGNSNEDEDHEMSIMEEVD